MLRTSRRKWGGCTQKLAEMILVSLYSVSWQGYYSSRGVWSMFNPESAVSDFVITPQTCERFFFTGLGDQHFPKHFMSGELRTAHEA